MSTVLALIELDAEGRPAASNRDVVAAASRLGDVVAVVAAPASQAAALGAALGELGATRVTVVDVAGADGLLAAAGVTAASHAVTAEHPSAVVAAHSIEGREIAAAMARESSRTPSSGGRTSCALASRAAWPCSPCAPAPSSRSLPRPPR